MRLVVFPLMWWACNPDPTDDTPPDTGSGPITDTDPPTTPTTPTTGTDTDTTSSPLPTLCDGVAPQVTSLYVTSRTTTLANAFDLHATLDAAAAIAAVCTREDAPDEQLLFSAESALDHVLPMHGFAGDTTYSCAFIATCPSSAAPESFTVVTPALPAILPQVTVSEPSATKTTAPPFTLLGHDRHCIGDSARMILFDQAGEIRWYYEAVPDIDVAFETQYLGDGLFSWGGGYYDGTPPELVDVDHNIQYTTASPIAQSHAFHHDGKIIDSGEMMLMMIEQNTDGEGTYWDGFSIGLVDTTTDADTYFYDSQTAVDAGDLPVGQGDPWHANWADYLHDPVNGDRLYVSLCSLGAIIAIDAATQEVVWKLGAGGDFTVMYPNGTEVPLGKAYPQCQHGLEFVPFPGGGGGNLLVYDNGAHGRGFSRMLEYEIDESTMVATMLWAWTEPNWMEPSWGDADYLPGGHVLATMGHACWSPNGNDVSSVVEVDPVSGDVAWRLDFPGSLDAIYRAERVDACDTFPISTMCPGVGAAIDTLAPILDPCGPKGTDVDQDGDGKYLCADLDCDDRDPSSYPGGVEACDGADNNCDGTIDDGFPGSTFYEDADQDGVGGDTSVTACTAPPGFATATGDCDDAQSASYPGAVEVCDGLDNSCEGAVDELPDCWGCTESGNLLGCTTRLDWDAARQVCLDLGGDLVSIEDQAGNDAVAGLASIEAWIGFNDEAAEGTFVWSDGSAATYTNWYSGEPNDWGGNEDCTGTNFGDFGTWNDYACSVTLPFVCAR